MLKGWDPSSHIPRWDPTLEVDRVMIVASLMLVPRMSVSRETLVHWAHQAEIRKVKGRSETTVLVVIGTRGQRCTHLCLSVINRALRLLPPNTQDLPPDTMVQIWQSQLK